MPTLKGDDQRRGTSRLRETEALRVAEEVVSLLTAGGESLSVGVITFYAAQRDLIMEKLSGKSITQDSRPSSKIAMPVYLAVKLIQRTTALIS